MKQFLLSVTKSCPVLCDPMDCSMLGLSVLRYLPQFAQVHVHWVSDVFQPSYPLSSPSPAFNISQHQGLFLMSQPFSSGGQSIGASASASVLPMNIQGWFGGYTEMRLLLLLLLQLLLSCFSCVRLCVTHRWQPTRLHHPWDSPSKNTGMGCHFLLQCMKVKRKSVAQSCSTLHDPMDCSPPGSSVHGIFQARVLEWGAIAFSKMKDKCAHLSQIFLQWINPKIY